MSTPLNEQIPLMLLVAILAAEGLGAILGVACLIGMVQ